MLSILNSQQPHTCISGLCLVLRMLTLYCSHMQVEGKLKGVLICGVSSSHMKLLKNCMQWVKNVRGQLIKGFLLLIAVLGWPTGCVSCPAVFLCGWGQAHLWYWLLPAVQHRTGTNIPFFAPSPILHSLFTLSVIKVWIGKFPCTPYVSTETIAHTTVFHVNVVSSTCGTNA